jgi:hypothetical protein
VGTTYLVEFDAAVSLHNADGKKDDYSSGFVLVDGKKQLTYTAKASLNSKSLVQQWDRITLHFVATKTETTLLFGEQVQNCLSVRDIKLSSCKAVADGCTKTCQGSTCDYWSTEEAYSCALLEKDYGCNCNGCTCKLDAQVCLQDQCVGKSCDQWVAMGVSCDSLKTKYGCTCNMCQCKPTKPLETCVIITGIFDGPLQGGPTGVELYTTCAVKDLSDYGFGSANNGKGTDGKEFQFPKVAVTEGTFFYLASDATRFLQFFNFKPEYVFP